MNASNPSETLLSRRQTAAPERAASTLPVDTRFTLGERLTEEQEAFFDTYGFIHFSGFISIEEIEVLRHEMSRVSTLLIDGDFEKINGVPIKYGVDADGSKMVQRFCYMSMFSQPFADLVRDSRFAPIRAMVGPGCRVGEIEKDGVVVNHYINVPNSAYSRLGWHTDGLRDVFYGRKPGPMLNVGVYIDDSPKEKGSLRILPSTHTQGLWKMATHKLYFLDHKEDPKEIVVEAKAGDLTVHDGRLWHRVGKAEVEGEASRRRIMYVPFIDGPWEPKNEFSKTFLYQKLAKITAK